MVGLTARVSKYEALLEEENETNVSSLQIYCKDPNYEIDSVEIFGKELFTCKSLVKKNVFAESYKVDGSFWRYSFNVYKTDEIFYHLLEGKC